MKSFNCLIFISFILIPMLGFSKTYIEEVDTTAIKKVSLYEVTVKSPKYNKPLFQLPVSATVLPALTITTNKIERLTDLSGYVPNFYMPEYGSKLTSPIYIRGMGTQLNSPSVGLYVDNIPYFEKSAFNFDFLNIESIEVLRGPQGTLYGRNTLGGLVNIFTREPEADRNTTLSADYGNYNQINASISHNQPINDKMGMILDFGMRHNDGFYTNHFNNTKVDGINSYTGHAKFNYQISDRLSLKLNAQYENSDQGGYPYAVYSDADQKAQPINYNDKSTYRRDLFSTGANLEYRMNNITFQSVTSYQLLNDCQKIDQDFTPSSIFFVKQNQNINMFAQEFNLESKKGGVYEWLFGSFLFKQWADKQVDLTYEADGLKLYKLSAPTTVLKTYDNTSSGAALYHQSVLNLGRLSITGGIRLNYERATLDYLYNTNSNGTVKQNAVVDSKLNAYVLLPKLALKYNLNSNLASYVSVARGYNAGGFNTSFTNEVNRSFKPESSWNYEAGVKSKWFNNRLYTNFCVFYIDWKNQQITQTAPGGIGSMTTNAGKSRNEGIELEIKYLPVEHLTTWFTAGYNDTKFIDNVKDSKTDYSNNVLPYAPKYTINTGVNYVYVLNNKCLDEIRFNTSYQGFGKIYWNEANSAWQNYYGLLNGRITAVKGNVEFGVWGKNLLNANYNSYYFQALGRSYVQIGKPVTLGVNLIYKF